MINTIGIIAALLLLTKVILHIILLSMTEDDFNLIDYGSRTSPKIAMVTLLPSMDEVPKEYQVFKTIINILYAISFVGLIIFLLGVNI
jgi:hypothetical protein